jgi:hypothetical protein
VQVERIPINGRGTDEIVKLIHEIVSKRRDAKFEKDIQQLYAAETVIQKRYYDPRK